MSNRLAYFLLAPQAIQKLLPLSAPFGHAEKKLVAANCRTGEGVVQKLVAREEQNRRKATERAAKKAARDAADKKKDDKKKDDKKNDGKADEGGFR